MKQDPLKTGASSLGLLGFLLLAGLGCSSPEEPPELAMVMGGLQRFAEKLGYAIEADNRPLSDFYLHEVTETIEAIQSIETYDGVVIAQPSRVIMPLLLERLRKELSDGDWALAWGAYEDLIDGCNRCHAATEHEFLEILPSSGQAPYSQRFRLENAQD